MEAWNSVSEELVSVTNTTVVNTETTCKLLHKIAALGFSGLIRLVVDNTKYQRTAVVMALAVSLKIRLLFLPSDSPNLNLIEQIPTTHRPKLETLMSRFYARHRRKVL